MCAHIRLRKNGGGVRFVADALSYDKDCDRPLKLDKLSISAKIITLKASKIIRMGVRLLMLLTNR